jgi:hypothetical protein
MLYQTQLTIRGRLVVILLSHLRQTIPHHLLTLQMNTKKTNRFYPQQTLDLLNLAVRSEQIISHSTSLLKSIMKLQVKSGPESRRHRRYYDQTHLPPCTHHMPALQLHEHSPLHIFSAHPKTDKSHHQH